MSNKKNNLLRLFWQVTKKYLQPLIEHHLTEAKISPLDEVKDIDKLCFLFNY